MVRFVTSDHEEFTVEKELTKHIGLLKDMDFEDDTQSFPLMTISSSTFRVILDYLQKGGEYGFTTRDETGGKWKPHFHEWEKEFIEKLTQDMTRHMECIQASNYLDIKSLLSLVGWSISQMMHGKTPREIRAMFGVSEEAVQGGASGQ